MLCLALDNTVRHFSLSIDTDEVIFNNLLPDYRRTDLSYHR